MNQHNRTMVVAIGVITALGPAVPVIGTMTRNQAPEMRPQR